MNLTPIKITDPHSVPVMHMETINQYFSALALRSGADVVGYVPNQCSATLEGDSPTGGYPGSWLFPPCEPGCRGNFDLAKKTRQPLAGTTCAFPRRLIVAPQDL